jgi:hypothetical protein
MRIHYPLTRSAANLLAVTFLMPGPAFGEAQLTKMVEFNTTGVHRDFIMGGSHYEVDGNVMLFLDWRWVYPGYPEWAAPPGVRVGDMSTGSTNKMPDVPLIYGKGDIPLGLRLEAQRPTLERRVEGDTNAFPQLQEDGLYKAWSVLSIPEAVITNLGLPPKAAALSYLESRDLKEWSTPSPNLTNVAGLGNVTNIVAILPTMAHGTVAVFKDPSGPPEERYKLIMVGTTAAEAEERYRNQWPADIDRYAYRGKDIWAMFGAVSPDGLHWKMLDLPLSIVQCDTPDMPTYYDTDLRKYVFYGRMRYGMRRANSRVETADFRHFPLPEPTLFSGPDQPSDYEWYSPSSVSRYPGTRQYHVMLPLMWRKADDTFAVYMATSLEGKHWTVLPPGPILQPTAGPLGQPASGGYLARQSLLELPDGRIAVTAQSLSMPHKYPFRPSHPPGGSYWAVWPRDRLVALVTDRPTEFRTPSAVFQGERLVLNCRTKQVGSIRVQVRAEGQILRSFEDCQPITGDFASHVVTWKNGSSKIGHKPGIPVVIELRMQMAELFSVRFE